MMIFVRDCNQMLFWLDDFSASSVAAFKNTMRVCAPCALLHFLFGSQQSFRSRQLESLQELGITKQVFYISQINLIRISHIFWVIQWGSDSSYCKETLLHQAHVELSQIESINQSEHSLQIQLFFLETVLTDHQCSILK